MILFKKAVDRTHKMYGTSFLVPSRKLMDVHVLYKQQQLRLDTAVLVLAHEWLS